MDPAAILRVLAQLTGGLRATDRASDGDLNEVRRAVAASTILRPALGTSNDIVGEPASAVDELDTKTRTVLSEIIVEVQQQLLLAPGPLSELHAFRRELPAATSHLPASQPSWALGFTPARSFGPFLSAEGLFVWFDLYRLALPLHVNRAPGGSPIVAFHLDGGSPDGVSYPVARGTVWVAASLLAADAPTGSCIALRVDGGLMRLSAPAAIAGAQIIVAPTTTVTLTLQLDHSAPVPAPVSFGPGGDARSADADLPREVTFVLAPDSSTVTCSRARVKAYGTTVQMRPAQDAVTYDARLQRVLVPYESSPRRLTIGATRSDLFTPEGPTPLERAAWAIPLVFPATGAVRAEGAGNGAMALLAQNIHASWRGLGGPRIRLSPAWILVEPGTLSISSFDSFSRRSSQRLDLWRDERPPFRRCSLELRYDRPAAIVHVSVAAGTEMLHCGGSLEAHIDRPVMADGGRMGLRTTAAALTIVDDTAGSAILVVARDKLEVHGSATRSPFVSFALANALLLTAPPDLFVAAGWLHGDSDVRAGVLHLRCRVVLLLPMLPDPYASNVANPREPGRGTPTALLTMRVAWPAPATPAMTMRLRGAQASAAAAHALLPPVLLPAPHDHSAHELRALLAEGRRHVVEEDERRIAALRSRFDDELASGGEQIFLLDVSSRADQFGVGLGFRGSRRDERTAQDATLRIDRLHLTTAARFLRVFTLPQVQWEPVWTIQNPNLAPFPSPLGSADDGGPTLLGINTVNLVPISPVPVVNDLVREFQARDVNTRAAALFTLPFGMKAVAAPLRTPPEKLMRGAQLEITQPPFPAANLAGGLQITLTAIDPLSSPTVESPFLPGATVQTRNGVDPSTGLPLFLSVIGDKALNQAETIFNNEFAPGGSNQRVPVTRIDFSGYGASLFSHWQNPEAKIAETSKVEFDVLVGRTAYEVIQVKSILYPWCVHVVRTITLQRTGGGGVFRRDSGWVAASDGVFDFPTHSTAPKIETHPGVVKGVFNVRRIRDTSHLHHRVYGSGPGAVTVQLAAVRFDADVRVAGAFVGAQDGRVTSIDQIGFVQLAPSGEPLTPDQYADLIADQGLLGGPVDCVVEVGGSPQHMRVTRVDIGAGRTMGGAAEFAAAARGSLLLPRDGQWSIVRQPADANKEAVPIDPHAGVPLVREGRTHVSDAANSAPYLFAEPAGLLAPALAPFDYGLLWATGTQRILFRRPRIVKGAAALTSDQEPLLADAYALITSTGLFPAVNACLKVPFANWSLEVPAPAQLRLALPQDTFPAVRVAGGLHRELSASSSSRQYVDYSNTRVTVRLDSTAAKTWEYSQTDVDLVYFTDGGHVKTSRGRYVCSSLERATFTLDSEAYGSALNPAKSLDLFSSTSMMGGLGGGGGTAPMDTSEGEGPNPKVGLKIDIKFKLPKGAPTGVGFITGGHVEIGTDFRNYFKLDIILATTVALIFPLAGKCQYEVEQLKKPAFPGSSTHIKAGEKHELVLAIGFHADGKTHFGPFEVEWELFIGVGFILERKPSTGLSVGIGFVFYAKLTIQYPNGLFSLVEAGVSVEGQAILLFEAGDVFLVCRGKLAFELTLAFVLNIEYELPEAELAKLEL